MSTSHKLHVFQALAMNAAVADAKMAVSLSGGVAKAEKKGPALPIESAEGVSVLWRCQSSIACDLFCAEGRTRLLANCYAIQQHYRHTNTATTATDALSSPSYEINEHALLSLVDSFADPDPLLAFVVCKTVAAALCAPSPSFCMAAHIPNKRFVVFRQILAKLLPTQSDTHSDAASFNVALSAPACTGKLLLLMFRYCHEQRQAQSEAETETQTESEAEADEGKDDKENQSDAETKTELAQFCAVVSPVLPRLIHLFATVCLCVLFVCFPLLSYSCCPCVRFAGRGRFSAGFLDVSH